VTAPKRDQTEDFHLRLPPLPEWPGKRYVIDLESDKAVNIIRDSPCGPSQIQAFGRVVGVFQRREPDPVPARTARALHDALSCCHPLTGECDGLAVGQVWETSRRRDDPETIQ
jgi:hypothetical protein